MDPFVRENTDVLKLFESKNYLKVCAPMVRYSKLQFRTLVRQYGCDLCYTPMILADSFCKSLKARNNEFTTNKNDSPLIVQLASNTVYDFVGAANMVAPYCDGVDLNCGCPQRWAKQMGLGCVMLENPEHISNIVKECRNTIPKPFTVSVKMRIMDDEKKTVDICRQLEKAGVSFLGVHARTAKETSEPINVALLKLIVESVACPIIANGGVNNLEECEELYQNTNCKGVMVANGMLSNPTLFSGTENTTVESVKKWLDLSYNSTISLENYSSPNHTMDPKQKNITFQCFHHHLVFMLTKILPKSKRKVFNNLKTFPKVLEFLENEYDLKPELYNKEMFKDNYVATLNYEGLEDVYFSLKEKYCNEIVCTTKLDYNYEENDGSYFNKVYEEG